MPRHTPLVEHAMEAQARLRELRLASSPLWAAAMASGDWTLMSRTHELAATLRAAEQQARTIAGLAEQIACPDVSARTPGHGRAA